MGSLGKKLMASWESHCQLNSFAVKSKDGTEVICEGHICFANLHGILRKLSTKDNLITEIVLGTTQGLKKAYQGSPKRNIPLFRKYLKYILCRSVFKNAFITKRLCDAVQYGINMDLTQPSNITVAAMTAVRRGWEYLNKVAAWAKFVELGVNEDFAFIASHFVREKENGSFMYNSKGWQSNHEIFGDPKGEEVSINTFLPLLSLGLKELDKPYSVHGWQDEFKVFRTLTQDWIDGKKKAVPSELFILVKDSPPMKTYRTYAPCDMEQTAKNLINFWKEYNA